MAIPERRLAGYDRFIDVGASGIKRVESNEEVWERRC
jgi:hypothetical protein